LNFAGTKNAQAEACATKICCALFFFTLIATKCDYQFSAERIAVWIFSFQNAKPEAPIAAPRDFLIRQMFTASYSGCKLS